MPGSHVPERCKDGNKRETLLLETKCKRNKSPGKEDDWRKADKKVKINHDHLSSHWRLQYVTRPGKAGSDMILSTASCPHTRAT
jgi:hypothetical protein